MKSFPERFQNIGRPLPEFRKGGTSLTYFTTVTGDMPAQEMGHCQPHEHVYIVETPALLTHPELRLTNLAASIEELKLYRIAGGTTLVLSLIHI